MNTINSGTIANRNGSALENFIESAISRKNYQYVDRTHFYPSLYLNQPIYSKQFPVGNSIYGVMLYCDFIIYHPQKHPYCLVIESKWQQSSGSVDEKFPYLVLNIKQQSPYQTIIILDGGGYKPMAEKWLRAQVDDKLIHVFNMTEFQTWVNKNNI